MENRRSIEVVRAAWPHLCPCQRCRRHLAANTPPIRTFLAANGALPRFGARRQDQGVQQRRCAHRHADVGGEGVPGPACFITSSPPLHPQAWIALRGLRQRKRKRSSAETG